MRAEGSLARSTTMNFAKRVRQKETIEAKKELAHRRPGGSLRLFSVAHFFFVGPVSVSVALETALCSGARQSSGHQRGSQDLWRDPLNMNSALGSKLHELPDFWEC